MFKRRDIPPVLLLLLLIILVMLTLSQILVVHSGRYGRNVHHLRKLQLELREMDINLHALMMQNVPSIELNRRLLQNQINAQRFAELMAEASRAGGGEGSSELPSSRLPGRQRENRSDNGGPGLEKTDRDIKGSITVPAASPRLGLSSASAFVDTVHHQSRSAQLHREGGHSHPHALYNGERTLSRRRHGGEIWNADDRHKRRDLAAVPAESEAEDDGVTSYAPNVISAAGGGENKAQETTRPKSLQGDNKEESARWRANGDRAIKSQFSSQMLQTGSQTDVHVGGKEPRHRDTARETSGLGSSSSDRSNSNADPIKYCPSIPPNLRK